MALFLTAALAVPTHLTGPRSPATAAILAGFGMLSLALWVFARRKALPGKEIVLALMAAAARASAQDDP